MIVSRPRFARLRGRASGMLATFAFSLAFGGCTKTNGIDCTPPPASLTCPDAPPSFAGDVYPNVFVPVCVPCHSPTGVEPSMPFTSYQQIYGSGGTEAREIFSQVFESCLMPPANAPVSLTDEQRQTLLDWFACGALDSGPVDGGTGD